MRLVRVAILVALTGLLACAREVERAPSGPRGAVLLIGVDGFEWDVALPMVQVGRLPVLADLMRRGTYGRLKSLEPTLSPIIWTTLATGKSPTKHGVHGFQIESESNRLYRSTDRRVKAFWNILTDRGQSVNVVGWWLTFPVERVRGVMVAQTNVTTREQNREGKGIAKGALQEGLRGQVYPEELQAEFISLVTAKERELPGFIRANFGPFRHPFRPLVEKLWADTHWALRADLSYLEIAERVLARSGRDDVTAVYFGGADVVGHRFWRFMQPALYDQRPTPEEVGDLGDVIRTYYVLIDSAIGRLLKAAPANSTVIVVSDHGMRAARLHGRFEDSAPSQGNMSGLHEKAAPGVFIAAGPAIRPLQSDPSATLRTVTSLREIGSVLDVTPTLLTMRGIPVGRDMDGRVLEDILADGSARTPAIDSHDTAEWFSNRPTVGYETDADTERKEQLRALGYIQ